MRHSLTIVAMLMLGGSAAAAAQDNDLWVGTRDVDVGRITAGTHVLQTVSTVNGERKPGYTETEEIAFVSWDDKRFLRQVVMVEVGGEVRATDTTFYDAQTLAPVRHASHASPWRTLSLSYWDDKVTGTVVKNDGAPEEIDQAVERRVYDPSSYLLLARTLPLEDGYGARLPLFNHEELASRWMSVWVNGIDWIETGEGKSEAAYVVTISFEGSDSESKYWITRESRLLVKTEASLGDGRTIEGWAKFTANAETETPQGMN